jgi:hypothetical protein
MHKTGDERNVMNVRCTEPGCGKQPSFGVEWMRPLHCTAHKTERDRNVKHAYCTEPGCGKRPTFGMEHGKPLHCASHKTDAERDVANARCIEPGCDTQSSYGTEWMKPLHCAAHKTGGDRDVKNERCTGRGGHPCPTEERAYFGKHCRYCADDDEVKVVRKKTEARCVKRILHLLGPLVAAHEQMHVPFDCADFVGSRAYPDVVLDHPRIRVLLEIDECQHFTYAASCEQRRMEAVTGELRLRSADARPIAWVRFNPDDWTGPASARDQLGRCREAAKAIRDLIESPRDGIVFVNYT